MRSLLLCSALLLSATIASGAGIYQRTRGGKTLVWNNEPKPGEEATWSGKRDKNGFATGSGTLTWYKVETTVVTGSNIPDARRHAVVISRYSGEMVQGKLEGPVTYVGANGKKTRATFVDGSESAARSSPTPRQTVTATPSPAATPTPAARQSPTPVAESKSPTALEQTPTPSPERRPTPTAQTTPRPTPEQTATPAPTPEPSASQPAEQNETVEIPTQVDESLRSLTAPPPKLRESVAAVSPQTSAPPTPPPLPSPTSASTGDDAHTVAALDTQYQTAVKNNDPATMDRILANDFVLMTGRGSALTKADLIKEAREKR